MGISNPFDDQTATPEPPSLDELINRSSNAGKNSAAEQGLEIPMGWKPTPTEPVPVVRCTATSTTSGERCKRWSIRGTTVCQTHGGRLPSVIEHSQAVVESARLRLMGLADDAVEVLYDLVQPGVPDAIRLKAAENVLNRTGIKEALEFKVEVTNNSSPSEGILKTLEIMRQRSLAAQAEAEAALEAEELVDEGEILDAEEPDETEE